VIARRPSRVWSRLLRLGLGVLVGAAVAQAGVLALDVGADRSPPAAMEPPRFVDETAAAGLDHVYDGDFGFFVGGGVAAFDCDDDGRPDLYLAGGEHPAGLHRNVSADGGPLRFEHLPGAATDLDRVTGAYPLDVDGDGHTDLAVLRSGENVLLRGLGGCRFARANKAWDLDGGDAWTTAFSATWEAGASFPTLVFGNYLASTDPGAGTGCAEHVLVRPAGSEPRFAAPTTLTPGWCSLSMLFSDWDRSGRADLRISNDRHYDADAEEQLWRLAAGQRPPRPYGRADGWQPLSIWGMGIASHDLTGDGHPEVFLTSQGDNKLQTLADGPRRPHYVDVAIERGVTAHRPHAGGDVAPSTAWHPEFEDVNNDAFVDLFVTKGNVDAMPGFATRDPDNLLLGQPDGTFVEAAEAAGLVNFARGRGAAVVDLNRDGLLDVVAVNRADQARVWRNVGRGDAGRPAPMGRWVTLRLEQPAPNRDAIGAWVEVRAGDRTLHREVTVGGGHAGGQQGPLHVGLGRAEAARVRVHWPGGGTGPWIDVAAGQHLTIERGAERR
jgi:enediyne biosynthesis protein E4